MPAGAGSTINRLHGYGLDAVDRAAQAIRSGEADLMVAGGGGSVSRAPFVWGMASSASSRNAAIVDTSLIHSPIAGRSYGCRLAVWRLRPA